MVSRRQEPIPARGHDKLLALYQNYGLIDWIYD